MVASTRTFVITGAVVGGFCLAVAFGPALLFHYGSGDRSALDDRDASREALADWSKTSVEVGTPVASGASSEVDVGAPLPAGLLPGTRG